MDPLAVLAYGAEQAPPLIGMEWRAASQAGPMHNPMEGTSVVLRDTIRLT